MKRFLWVPWRWWRRTFQLALLLLFLWLFRRAEYHGADTLPGGENLFFHLDPLAGAAAMLAGRCVIAAFWPALTILLLTLALGRFFCGWVCPMGTLLDLFQRLSRPLAKRTRRWARSTTGVPPVQEKHGHDAGGSALPLPSPARGGETRGTFLNHARLARYILLFLCLFGAAFAFPLVGYADPFALLVRGLTFWADPIFLQSADALLTWSGRNSSDPVRRFFVRHLLPFRANVFELAGVSAALLAALFALELVARRFWCRYLCPLGALLGLAGRLPLVRRVPARVCKDCGACANACRMGALDAAAGFSPEACNLCMDCVDTCPRKIAKFTAAPTRPALAPLDVSRRRFLVAAAAGAAVPAVAQVARLSGQDFPDPGLLRPPGAGGEDRFLGLCIRCGMCMKICPTNVLQPAILQAGVEGMFSPRLAPRFVFEQTYCEYNCNLCSQVCPTGAIPRLTLEQKQKLALGKAYFDHNLCLPWAKKTSCIRCEEVCPLPDKAIKVPTSYTVKGEDGQEVEIQEPVMDRDLCIGCGICETNCPLEGLAGVRVRRVEAPDPHTEFLSKPAVECSAAPGDPHPGNPQA